jgi:hypothetical protein
MVSFLIWLLCMGSIWYKVLLERLGEMLVFK